jgi:glycosyltransferase involved in cell wall biosynthesis
VKDLYITVAGYFDGHHSLCEVNRVLAIALETKRPGSVGVAAVEPALQGLPSRQRDVIARLSASRAPASGPRLTIYGQYPLATPADRKDPAIAFVFWEEGRLPAAMVGVLNRGYHGVFAPSTSVQTALIDSGVTVPIVTVGFSPDLDRYLTLGNARHARADRPFTFLHVSSCFPRKGVDVLLEAYARSFRRSDNVRLVIKGFPNPHNNVDEQLERLRSKDPGLAEIAFINADIDEDALLKLYAEADAMVLPSRGEGFNIPGAEALAAGLRLIVTGFGGHMDYCAGGAARLLKYRLGTSESHFATPDSLWAEPDVDDLVRALHELAADQSPSDSERTAIATALKSLDPVAWADRIVAAAGELLLRHRSSSTQLPTEDKAVKRDITTAELAPLPPRLFTVHRSVLYVDIWTGELRHGPHLASPANVRLVSNGEHSEIVHTPATGGHVPIVCGADGCRTIDAVGDPNAVREPTVLQQVALSDGWIGLTAGDVFLSAMPGGRLKLASPACRAWESFLPSDPRPAAVADRRRRPCLSVSCVETRDPAGAVRAIESTAACIHIDRLYWFSTFPYPGKLAGVDIVNVNIPEFVHFWDDTNRISLQVMPKVVTTDFNLIVQADGFAVNPQAWDDMLFEYDYAGAIWPWMWGGPNSYLRGPMVGNGGFSLRSRKLYDALLNIDIKDKVEDWASDPRMKIGGYFKRDQRGTKRLAEDVIICLWYRHRLETEFGIRFCPPELASKFSVETRAPVTEYWVGRSFGFHGPQIASNYGVTL